MTSIAATPRFFLCTAGLDHPQFDLGIDRDLVIVYGCGPDVTAHHVNRTRSRGRVGEKLGLAADFRWESPRIFRMTPRGRVWVNRTLDAGGTLPGLSTRCQVPSTLQTSVAFPAQRDSCRLFDPATIDQRRPPR